MKKIISLLMLVFFLFTSFAFSANAAALKGDVNGDGTINSTDALNVLQYVVGIVKSLDQSQNADVNSDGSINSADALEILKIVVGIVNPTTPSSTADIVKYYNNAVNKVNSSKAGYTKKTTSNLGQLEGAEAILKIKVAKDAIYDFLGIGTTTYANKKGEAKYLGNANLAAGDVKSAKCDVSGTTYTITMSLKDGNSSAPGGSDNSPLQRCGLYVGSDGKKEYDYKSANNLYLGLNGADDTSVEAVKERTTGANITAKIDSASGKMISLDVSFNWEADLTKVKYTIITISGVGHADTKVSVSDFKW